MTESVDKDAVRFYDAHAERKLRDFVEGNQRIRCAWDTLVTWGGQPSRVLEIGCGAGSICWQMAGQWPSAEILGVDFSPGNLAIAKQVFGRDNVRFELLAVDDTFAFGRFDLIVMMDVYEHVAPEQRARLHENLNASLAPGGRVILTVPTPRHLAWLRTHRPSEIQPVDENITPEVLCSCSRALGLDLLMYQEVGVWTQGDYAHAVLGTAAFPAGVAPRSQNRFHAQWNRRKRLQLVREAGYKL